MNFSKDLSAIFDRIANGEETEGDMQTLRRLLRVGDSKNLEQVGNNIVNISEGRDIQIGDRIYQGADAQAIKEALRLVLQEKQKVERPRNERLLLQAVKDEVNARLKQSLHNALLINLEKEAQPEQVKPLWSSNIKIGNNPSESIPDTTSILEVFDQEEIAGRLLILGNPGAGKTTTMLDLAKALTARAETQPDKPIPVLFNLSFWKDDRQQMTDWLVAELQSKYGIPADIGKNWLKERQLLLMLDGLDELESQRQEPCVQAINQLLTGENYPLYLVVCSRTEEYENLAKAYKTRLQLNGAICLQPLTNNQIREYLSSVNHANLQQTINSDPELLELVKTPFLLSVTVLVSEEISIDCWQQTTSTADRLQFLLDAYVRRMLAREFKSKAFLKCNQPSTRQTRLWLVYLAQQLERELETEFLLENIQPSWLSTNNHRWMYGMVVRLIGYPSRKIRTVETLKFSFQSAISLVTRSVIICARLCIIIFDISDKILLIKHSDYFTDREKEWIEKIQRIWIVISLLLAIYVHINMIFDPVFLESVNIQPNSFHHLIHGIFYFPFSWFISYMMLVMLFSILIPSLIFVFLILYGIPSIGIIGTLQVGLSVENKQLANQGIKLSAANALISGLIFWIIGGAAFATIYSSFTTGLILGLVLGLIGSLMRGGLACIQHLAIRLILYLNGYIPWNYARFLDYCTERLFLQRVGGRYRFIHKLLQEHFAAMPLEGVGNRKTN